MNKAIKIKIFGLSTLLILILSFSLSFVFYKQFQVSVLNELKSVTQVLVINVDETKYFQVEDFRITILDLEGNVTYDNYSHIMLLDNHLMRPEIQSAINNNEGHAIRRSSTLGTDVYYYALKLDDSIVRVSCEAASMYNVFSNVMIWVLIVLVIVWILMFYLSNKMANSILRPIRDLSNNLNVDDVKYDELLPFVKTFKSQNDEIQNMNFQLNTTIEQIDIILKNMQEGLIFLDINKNIILANKSVASLLNCSELELSGKPCIYLSRENGFIDLITNIKSTDKKSVRLSLNNIYLRIYINGINIENEFIGWIIIVSDMTKEYENDLIRQEFSANVSHELKTPLTSILGYTELIEAGLANEADTLTFVSKVSEEAKRLLSIINDIIELSRLDNLEMITKEKVDLLQISQDISTRFKLEIENKQLKLSIGGNESVINANNKLIDEMIYNLIDNSIKYSEPNKEIFINIYKENDFIVFKIKDQGLGISKFDQEHIFERFYRVDKSHSKLINGSGLGLAIVKHIGIIHNATIEVDSEIGEGTAFIVKFPAIPDKTNHIG